MHRFTSARRACVGLAVAGLLIVGAGCGSDDDPGGGGATTGGASETQTQTVTFRLPFVFNGGDAPFFYAQQLGYYAEEGIELEITDSKGSSQTVADVASGGSDFGEAAAASVMLAVAQGQPVTSVATTLGKSSFGFIVPRDGGIASIEDLRGKSIAVTALVAPSMNAALAAAGLSEGDVRPVLADATAIIPTYLSGRVDALYTSGLLAGAVQAQRPSNVLLQADAGFNPPDYALIAKPELLEQQPELVAGFVRATLRGFEAARRDPQAATDALLAEQPQIDPAQALGTLKAAISFYCSRAQAGQPYGENAASDWTTAAEALQEFAGLRGATDGERFFTNELFEDQDVASIGTC